MFAIELDGAKVELARILAIKTITKGAEVGVEVRCSIYCLCCGKYIEQTFQMWESDIRETHTEGENDGWRGESILAEIEYRITGYYFGDKDLGLHWYCPKCGRTYFFKED